MNKKELEEWDFIRLNWSKIPIPQRIKILYMVEALKFTMGENEDFKKFLIQ